MPGRGHFRYAGEAGCTEEGTRSGEEGDRRAEKLRAPDLVPLHVGLDDDAAFGFRIARDVVVDVDVVVACGSHLLHAEVAVTILVGVVADVMVHVAVAVHGVHVVEFEVVGTAADGRAVVGRPPERVTDLLDD